MASFWQWRFPHEFTLVPDPAAPGKKKRQDTGVIKPVEVARVSWLCGAERVLVEEAIDTIIENLSRLTTLTVHRFTVGSDETADIWAELNQFQMSDTATSLVLVRGVDAVKDWTPMTSWIEGRAQTPNNYLLLVSDDSDFPLVETKDEKRPLREHVQLIQRRGHVIKCSMPTSGDAIAEWIQSKKAMPEITARYLIERVGGELREVRDVCDKLAALPGTPGPEVIDALAPARPADDFVDALCRLDKASALASLAELPSDDYSRVIAFLDARLSRLGQLQDQLRRGMSVREIAINDKAQQLMYAKFKSVAKYYDPAKVELDRRALALVDSVSRRGGQTGVMEALVALW